VQTPVLRQTSAREKLGQEVPWLLRLVEREQGLSQKEVRQETRNWRFEFALLNSQQASRILC
jgi:hypothetical protein